MSDWQPIETAPKDGSAFYVWLPNWNGRGPLVRTAWLFGGWANEFLNGINANPEKFKPTHWMPITPPTKGTTP